MVKISPRETGSFFFSDFRIMVLVLTKKTFFF